MKEVLFVKFDKRSENCTTIKTAQKNIRPYPRDKNGKIIPATNQTKSK